MDTVGNSQDEIVCTVGTHFLAADRAKSIKTKAVVNESPTEKLIRELKEENARLMEAIKKGGLVMVADDDDRKEGVTEEGRMKEGVEEGRKTRRYYL